MFASSEMGRRELISRALLLVGASAVPVDAVFAAPKAKSVLKGQAFKTLSAVADTIIPRTDTPGAIDVGVPRLFDGLLRNWASPARRAELLGALDRIDALAKSRTGKGFAALAPAKRKEILVPHDAAALKPVPRTDGLKGIAAALAGPAYADAGYGKLKELIVVLYYSTEVALTKELTYQHAPGKWQPSVPLTPDTRAAGGAGGIV